jgi:hypothetical protein
VAHPKSEIRPGTDSDGDILLGDSFKMIVRRVDHMDEQIRVQI